MTRLLQVDASAAMLLRNLLAIEFPETVITGTLRGPSTPVNKVRPSLKSRNRHGIDRFRDRFRGDHQV